MAELLTWADPPSARLASIREFTATIAPCAAPHLPRSVSRLGAEVEGVQVQEPQEESDEKKAWLAALEADLAVLRAELDDNSL